MSESSPKKRRLGRLWTVVAIVVVLAFAVLLVVPALIDAEAFRPQVERVLRDATGWDAELGAVDLSIFRGALGVSPATLTAPGGDTSKIEVARIDVKVGLFALLRKELRVESIHLVRPEILLVRPDEATGWVVPVASGRSTRESTDGGSTDAPAGPGTSAKQPAESKEPSRKSDFKVVIQEVGVRDGELHLEDRAVRPAMTFEMSALTGAFNPEDMGIRGELTFGRDDGKARWRGQIGKTLEVTLDGVKTDLLHAFLGPDLVQGGGRLSGEVTIGSPLRIEGNLEATELTLLAGERPFDDAGIEFVIAPDGLGWQLERLTFHGDGVRLVGGGPLAPALALKLELPETPLDAFLRASESVLPLPLEIVSPGTVEATIRVDQPQGKPLTYEASGALTAAEVRPGEMLPAAQDVVATFALNRDGQAEVKVESGTIAGGPVSGRATIDSVNPPGSLKFSGGLQDAVFGELLGGLVADAKPVRGPTGFDAALGVDLTREVLDARSLSGRVDFGARELSMPGWDLDGAIRGKLEEKAGSGAAGLLQGLLDKDSGKNEVSAGDVVETVERLIDSLEGTLDMDRWPWGLDNVRLGVGDVASTGSGWFDPEQATVDFTLTSQLSADESKKLLDKHSVLKFLADGSGRLTLPVRVTGSLLEPSIGVELDKALGSNLSGDDGDKKKDDVKGLLKGLLDRKLKKD